MTEERKFCRICKNLGIDCEVGTFYCSLSHRPDKLPNTLKCDEFILCDFITRLEQENREEKKAYNECMYYLTCMTEQRNKLKTALEEIRRTVMHIIEDNGRHNLSDFSSPIRIEKIINEVLNDTQDN